MANVREAIKWIDGNTNYSTPVYDSPRFNVDDPTFSIPMPVISGLASGYCERRALLDPVFPTGAATTANWNTDDTTKERIVNNVAQNLALGVTGAALSYDNTTAAFNPVAPLATANNYMTAMDAAITSLVFGGTADPVYKRNTNGAPYGNTAAAAFTALATDAQATAADTSIATSAIALPVSGGANYSVAMNLGLPVAWAKERKWMLDELKYTVRTNAPSELLNVRCNLAYIYDKSITASTFNAALVAARNTVTQGDLRPRYLYFCGDTANHIEQHRLGRTALFVATCTNTTWSSNHYYNPLDVTQAAANAIYIDKSQHAAGTVTLSAVFAQDGLYKFSNGPDAQDFVYDTVYTAVTQGQAITAAGTYSDGIYTNVTCYEVFTGGTLNIPATARVYSILVHNGGVVNFTNGGSAETCIVLAGGTCTGYPYVRQYLSVDGFHPIVKGDGWSGIPDSAILSEYSLDPSVTYNVVTTATTYNATTHKQKVFVGTDGVLTITGQVASDPSEGTCLLVVGSGGTIILNGASTSNKAIVSYGNIIVLPGGTLNCVANFYLQDVNILVYPGATIELNEDGDAQNINSYSRIQLAADSNAIINLPRNTSAQTLTPSHFLNAPCAFHFKPGCINTTTAQGKPNLTVTVGGSTYTGSICRNTPLICMFHNLGLTLNGSTVGVQDGENQSVMDLVESSVTDSSITYAVYGLASYDASSAVVAEADDPGGAHVAPYFTVQSDNLSAKHFDVVVRCAVVTCAITAGTISPTDNNYDTFKVRQFKPET